jgi:hypothetical protein
MTVYTFTHVEFFTSYLWCMGISIVSSAVFITIMKRSHSYDHNAMMFVCITFMPMINMLYAMGSILALVAFIGYKTMDCILDLFIKVCIILHISQTTSER